ncbi:biotin carboxylase N-terminal domain-containing protein [Schaalia sp. JY-X159]|uniref:acetyl/propionyl/methylcrotonyl-CoA carboxylase subunit alpha n=1 Tax=Schaalia sp. JY-X159 TaxID=2758575 RepID=UPI00165E9743|nr:biotin carboxylase N-terminal domain-containing protein [Schaalia sp. JY-X159]
MTTQAISKVLVANRGEIALRIIRSVQESGRTAVAVYADQDMDAQFVRAADEAYALRGTTATDTYLSGDKIIEIAKTSGADAVHPGYGFLAENATFAKQVIDAGLNWIGPRPEVIDLLGDKIRARKTALSVGVSPVPGTQEPLRGRAEVEDFIAAWGYPVVLKAADGGGGRGIHVLNAESDLDNFFTGRELTGIAGAGFFIERYVPKARHLETQSGRDSHGTFTVYSTRDCSVQRRHQKLIEEAPAPFITPETEALLLANSKSLFDAVDYVGLGTCEYLLSDEGELYFLEVNPRLQVEHTVTEEVAGVDLVAAQLAIAAGEEIPVGGEVRGHSIELRVTSEDPGNDLIPTMGTLTRVAWPTGPGIRIDTGIGEGDAVSPEFDSMVAKIIVTAPTREQAIERALRVTRETVLEGVSNPLPLYAHILSRPEFALAQDGNLGVWTRWLESGVLDEFGALYAAEQAELGAASPAATPAAPAPERTRVIIELDGKRAELTLPANLLSAAPAAAVKRAPQPLRSSREAAKRAATGPVVSKDSVVAPSQAIVVRIATEVGANVAEGDVLAVLESMKMESYVLAPRAGRIEAINVEVGANVAPGHVLVTLSPEAETNEGGEK